VDRVAVRRPASGRPGVVGTGVDAGHHSGDHRRLTDGDAARRRAGRLRRGRGTHMNPREIATDARDEAPAEERPVAACVAGERT
jgi:hypothetical protein